MIGWLVFVGYLVGVIATAAGVMRWTANHCERCPQVGDYCRGPHVTTCWRGDGTVGVREVWAGMLVGIVWPVSFVPLLSYYAATYKPTPKADAAYVADLERQCGIGADA